MVKKTLGYVELEWTCPACGAHNPGTQQTCQSCGAKMPEDVKFEAPVKQVLDSSAETIARVAVGPDIHCPYCGARNPGNAETCSQCGGDLVEGFKRAKGQTVGAFQTGPVPDVTCPHCGANNPASATKCTSCGGNLARPAPKAVVAQPQKKSVPLLGGGLALVFLCVIALLFFLFRGSAESVATVRGVEWVYTIHLEELGPVTREAWRGEVPSGAQVGNCKPQEHHVQDEPAANATEVCGTPYLVDTGTGHAQAVQDCEYHVYQDWCEYTVTDWKPAGEKTATGRDLNPLWPAISLNAKQRAAERIEVYEVILDADGKDYTYRPGSLDQFRQFQIGSKWIVETNALGGVTSVTPSD
ncbi:MAG: double zinc ribbon domain-containing protein [Chloroflexota bacterium]